MIPKEKKRNPPWVSGPARARTTYLTHWEKKKHVSDPQRRPEFLFQVHTSYVHSKSGFFKSISSIILLISQSWDHELQVERFALMGVWLFKISLFQYLAFVHWFSCAVARFTLIGYMITIPNQACCYPGHWTSGIDSQAWLWHILSLSWIQVPS